MLRAPRAGHFVSQQPEKTQLFICSDPPILPSPANVPEFPTGPGQSDLSLRLPVTPLTDPVSSYLFCFLKSGPLRYSHKRGHRRGTGGRFVYLEVPEGPSLQAELGSHRSSTQGAASSKQTGAQGSEACRQEPLLGSGKDVMGFYW